MSSFYKLKLLVWKNCVLQKRHKWQTGFEIASPVIFSTFLILVRCIVDLDDMPAMDYEPFFPTYFNITGQDLGNISEIKQEGTLAFSPENPLTRAATADAMSIVAKDNLGVLALFFNADMLPPPKGYPNAKAMEKALTQPNAMKTILVGVQFEDDMTGKTKWPDHVVVTLRFPAVMRTPMVEHPLRASWRTNLLYPIFPRSGPRYPADRFGGRAPGYSPELFLGMQHALSRHIIQNKTGQPVSANVLLCRMPLRAFKDDPLLIALERFISMIIMLSFAYTFVNTVRMVTAEKELQLKETMTIMGLPSWLHWTAWFIKQFSFLLISVFCMVVLVKIPFHNGVAVLTYVPWSVLIFFMLLYMIASLAFSFMISVFFSRANTAASFMGLAWLTTYSFYMITQVLYEDISIRTKLILSLFSNTAMGFAFQMIVTAEGTERGLQWEDFFKPITYHDSFKPAYVALLLLFDAFIYMVIALYVEKIRPGTYGVPQPWYFPFTKNFWMPSKNRPASGEEGADLEYNDALLKVVHDEEPKGVKMGVNIKNLTKIYKGNKKAVDNLNLRMYENEITVLLGHNGAGKTTSISMMIGMVSPTSGTAMINGYDIVTQTEQARKSIGICPQHNVLFPTLTVAEHIQFYGRLKGVPEEKIKEEVNHFVNLLELEEKKDIVSKNLSGGQQRRLSVGIAICGSSKVVLLDEPTSGLDPAARRALWDLLQKEKKGRTMILTTHFMDEADILGDRVAIMSGGRLQCVGTSYFLKKHYGIGYKLTIVKENQCDAAKVTEFFTKYVPDIKENTNIGSELTYILTNEHVAKFPNMLKELEEVKTSLKVSSYGLSVTSLEEVFMKAGIEDADADSEPFEKDGTSTNTKRNAPIVMKVNVVNVHPKDNSVHANLVENNVHDDAAGSHNGQPQDIDFNEIQKVRGRKLLWNHIEAMFLKLAYNSIRSKLVSFIQLVTPIINIFISVAISRSWRFMAELPPLTLSLKSGFNKTNTLLGQDEDFTDLSFTFKMMHAYKDYFKSKQDPNMIVSDVGTDDVGKHYLKMFESDPMKTRYETIVGATFGHKRIIGWFSNYGYHDSAISLALVNDAILRSRSPNSSLQFVNHPLPYSIENLVRVMATGSSMGFQFAFNIGFCMAFVTAFIVLFVVKERVSGAKLLQRVSGVRPIVMWSCAYLWDWLWLALIHVIIVIVLACFQEDTLSTPAELGRVFLVLIVFSVAAIPQHYLASFLFDSPASGFSKMCFLNMFLGCMPFLIVEVLKLPELGNPYYANIFDWIFAPLPLYCLSRSFRDLCVSSFKLMACDGLCDMFNTLKDCTRQKLCSRLNIKVCCIEDDPYLNWNEPGIGRYIFMMLLVGVLLFTTLLLMEYGIFKKLKRKLTKANIKSEPPPPSPHEDSDVAAERHKVAEMTFNQMTQHSLVTKDLTKYYKHFLAVNRLSFAVIRGECFGLLGVNGAGKTSTFRMLTGDSSISSGDAFVHGNSVKLNIRDVHQLIGYCPQFDALLDNLTARETLRIFCLMRGIPLDVGAARAEQLAATLGFTRHYDKKIHECSGGTKRKISTAVALLGDSPLIYLDEPTTGMDPASKRLTWSAISKAVSSDRSVVLTSHSMEECEALCSRLTVMVRGQFFCVGPLQHLKSKFSQGYTLIVRSTPEPDRNKNVAKINEYIMQHFPGSKLVESYLGICTYYLNDTQLPWWRVFYVMEEARGILPLEDYSVSQTTLEQVFLRFTRTAPERESRV